MARKNAQQQIDRLIMNNCKIANELRKYRDLAGCVNQVSLSGKRVRRPSDAADYAEYFISEDLSYLDMVVANAAYTLMVNSPPQAEFQADVIARIMAGNMERRIDGKRRQELEGRLQKLAGVQLYILADHDHQVEQDLYEGAFLPVEWEKRGGRIRFHFLPGQSMPLYQYAQHHRQLIEVPFDRLRDDQGENQIRHNNNDRTLLLRHYLLQELEILLYQHNSVEDLQIRLMKRDQEGNEFGLLWTLGMIGDEETRTVKDLHALARNVQNTMQQLLENWQVSGYLGPLQYEMVPEGKNFGVKITSRKQK